MAPSSRTRTQHQRPQAPVFRVTKSSRLNERPASYSKQKHDALEKVISENAPPAQESKVAPSQTSAEPAAQHAKKRRRNSEVNETAVETNTLNQTTKRAKKTCVSLPLSSSLPKTRTQNAAEDLPEVLQDLRQLHKHLLHALSVHYAHTKGGIRDTVDLLALLPTMTRLWRKKTVQVQDVQRALALWEFNIDAESDITNTTTTTATATATATVIAITPVLALTPAAGSGSSEFVTHALGPFKIEQVGIGAASAVTLEYIWSEAATTTTTREAFIETDLQRRYEERLHQLSSRPSHRDGDGSFTWKRFDDVPRLQCRIGKITQLRREKVASIKSHILSKATPYPSIPNSTPTPDSGSSLPAIASATVPIPTLQPDLSRLSIHGPSSPPRRNQIHQSQQQKQQQQYASNVNVDSAKSRTLNLFDRVRAKQQLNAATTTLTPAQQLRQRALQRIPELVDVLRLKQARKLVGHEMHVKVSFSFEALVQEIRDSLRSEVAGEEIREGIVILGRDVPGEWCRVYEVGSVRCVTLQGEAVLRREVEEWCRVEKGRAGVVNV